MDKKNPTYGRKTQRLKIQQAKVKQEQWAVFPQGSQYQLVNRWWMLTGCWVHWPVLCSVSRGSATHPGMFVSASSVLSDANTHSHTHIVMAVKLHLSSWSSHRGKIHYQKNPHKNLQWFMRWRYFSRSVNILLLCEWDWRSAWIHTSQTAGFFCM